MPNQRQLGTKLAGAYISAKKDDALAKLAAKKGYANKAEFIRDLFDAALAEDKQRPKRPQAQQSQAPPACGS
jgi:Arc/MetJ-type ribon-helix-helix transcriptional regulator